MNPTQTFPLKDSASLEVFFLMPNHVTHLLPINLINYTMPYKMVIIPPFFLTPYLEHMFFVFFEKPSENGKIIIIFFSFSLQKNNTENGPFSAFDISYYLLNIFNYINDWNV